MASQQIDFLSDPKDLYPEGFWNWLRHNQHIWRAFEAKALRMAKVRDRYSARTIVEVLRWHSDLQEHKPLFKLSNNMTPGMARYWMEKHGARYPKFFCLHQK